MEFGVLGPLIVRTAGREVTPGPAKQRALLALLIVHRNEIVPVDTLVDGLWDGRPPATAHKIIQGYVSQVRRAIGGDVLQTRPGGYRLELAPDDVDAVRFEGLLERGRASLTTNPRAAVELLNEAMQLWRGPALAEFGALDFAVGEADRLDQLRLLALEGRIEADIALGRHAAIIPELRALTRAYPLREDLRGLHMLALYRAGRQGESLAVYADARTTLVEELGIEPGDPLVRLEHSILVHDPALDPSPHDPPPHDPPPHDHPPHDHPPHDHPAHHDDRPAHRRPTPVARPAGASVRPTAPVPTARMPRVRVPVATSVRRIRRRRRPVALMACVVVVAACVLALTRAEPVAATRSTDSVVFIGDDGTPARDRVDLASTPTALVVDGSAVWAVEPAARTVTRIDPGAGSVVRSVAVGSDPSGVAAGGGDVWVADHGDDTVSRISPATNAVVATIPVGAGPLALTDGFGSVWVTNGDDRTVTRIDEGDGRVTATIPTGAVGDGIAIGNGQVWVTDETGGRVVAIDPATNAVAASTNVGNGPTGIAAADGSLWVVNALDDTVSRVDTTSLAVDATIPVADDPTAVVVSAGAVWVGARSDPAVVRIDPGRRVVTGSTQLGGPPAALAATEGGVWVADGGAGNDHRGGRLVVVGDVESVDPSVQAMPEADALVYDALTGLRHTGGSAGTQLVPDLAVALPHPTAGGTSYTFHLRPNIAYSDGRALQPLDFRRGLERLLRLSHSLGPSFAHVLGATTCASGLTCDLSAGVQFEGDSTVTFHLSTPDPRFLEELSFLTPIPDGAPDQASDTVLGTGPYQVHSDQPGQLLVLDRNPFFRVWSATARPDGYPDEVVFRTDPDNDDAVRQIADGRADLTELVGNSTEAARLASEHPSQVHTLDQQATVLAFLNTRVAPFDDVRVRRAVNDAVNRAYVAQLYGAYRARPTCQIVPPTTTGYRPYCPYTAHPDATGQWWGADPALGTALVEASGTAGTPVTLWTFPDFADEASYLAEVLDELGYPTTIHETADAATYFDTVPRTTDIQAGLWGWFGSPLAVDALSVLACDYRPNPAQFCDPQIDAQIRQLADTEPADPDGSRELAAQIDREITDQAPWVPLFTPQTQDVTSARIGNYQVERGRLLIDQLWVQ